VHKTRDVHWKKIMFLASEEPVPIQAEDSVELFVKKNFMQLQTLSKPASHKRVKTRWKWTCKAQRGSAICP
jgi:hypothetical protein